MKNTLLALYNFDLHLSKGFQLQKPGLAWRAAALLAQTGDSWIWALGLALLWLATFSHPAWHRNAAILEISVVIQALAVFALKRLFRRERPNGNSESTRRQIDPHSFPSGHATRAVMLALMALSLGPAWFAWVLLIWAPLVCLSRVLTGMHYLSDILGGVLLGLILGPLLLAFSTGWIRWFPFLF